MSNQIKNLIASLKGISGTGNVLEKFRELQDGGHLTLDPGDYSGGDGVEINVAAPIAYDVWYLHNHVNLVETEEGTEDRGRTYVDEQLVFLAEKLGGIRPLRALLNLSQLGSDPIPWWSFNGASENWENNGVYFVQQAVFETQIKGEGINFPSRGPEGYDPDQYSGYIAVPMGQLGVMEVISVFGEATHLEAEDFELRDESLPVFQIPPEMFPPRERAGENLCFGRHLLESGYAPAETEKTAVEILASHFPADIYPDIRPKGWLRLWLRKEDRFPVPGEFIGFLCKPAAVPPHVWWFQKSSPFLYAGCWFETRHLTSGVVTEVVREADRADGGIGNLYTVRVQGREVLINASDFFEYEKDDRVGILKMAETQGEQKEEGMAFLSLDQVRVLPEDEGEIAEDLVIVPIAFYNEEG